MKNQTELEKINKFNKLSDEEKKKIVEQKVKEDGKKVKIIVPIILLTLLFLLFKCTCDSEPEVKLTKAEIHKQNIEKLFHPWDGSNIVLEQKIKESLNDPESYEHITTSYIDTGDFLSVKTVFTAKNGFGGVIKQEVVIQQDTLGNIIKVVKWFE
ncbi:hypothetical protein [Flavobacterium aquicola]|uniref:Uncharacterized protein n=1 Tax=Flavobacterium aquicola TaxID=1682742 RepID=A0A3E0EFV3_9FLAO|nr:hypothetical protein [Flavobacterium aquicola]REG96159.1 hypothetical protein C8P67_111133 [Flavobacterium aquicola]